VNLENLKLRILVGKAALMMGVPEERDFRGGIEKAIESLCRSEDVFIFILKCAVDKHNAIRRQRPLWQS